MLRLEKALAPLRPDELFPLWCWVDELERCGQIGHEAAAEWKHGIYKIMLQRKLSLEDLLPQLPVVRPPC